MKPSTLTSLAALTCGLLTPSLHAAFVAVDTFESASLGALNGQNSWTAGSAFTVATDPSGASNKVLAVSTNPASAQTASLGLLTNAIADNSTGTLYFRFYQGAVTTAQDTIIGLTPSAPSTTTSTYASYGVLRGDNNLTQPTSSVMQFQNGSTAGPSISLTDNSWYQVWMVFNAAANTYDAYLQGGSSHPTQTSVASSFAFRTSTGNLSSLILRVGNVNQLTSTYLDDFYIDKTGANLAAPIPEPSAFAALAGLATLTLVATRRRRRAA